VCRVVTIQRVVKAPISSSVAPVCVYQHATDVMTATNAETGPTKPTAVSHAQISLDLRVIENGSVPIYFHAKYTQKQFY